MMGLVYQVFRCFQVINALRIGCDQAINPFSKEAPSDLTAGHKLDRTFQPKTFTTSTVAGISGTSQSIVIKNHHESSDADAFRKQVETILHVTLKNQPPIPEIPHIYPTKKPKPTKHASLCKLRRQSFPIYLGLGYKKPLVVTFLRYGHFTFAPASSTKRTCQQKSLENQQPIDVNFVKVSYLLMVQKSQGQPPGDV